MSLADADVLSITPPNPGRSLFRRRKTAASRGPSDTSAVAANDGLCPGSRVAAQAWGLSLVAHALVLWMPAWLWSHMPQPQPEPRTMLVELSAMQGQRSLDATAPRQAQVAAVEPRPQAPTHQSPHVERVLMARTDSPVTVVAPESASQPSLEPPPDTPAQPHNPVPAIEGADANRFQQAQTALTEAQAQAEAMRRYLSQLKKAVQAHLVYPSDAKAAGWMGSPVVMFQLSEDGQMAGGSLRLQRSSGVISLDENALEAVRASAPLPRPPKAMTVALAISFAREP